MASITKEKRGGTVRINISAKEFERLIPDDANRSLVKHWIDLGREREGIREHVDEVLATRFAAQKDEIETLHGQVTELKKALDDFIVFFAQVAHGLTISTTANSQFDLESIHFDKLNGNKLSYEAEQTYKLALIKHAVFKQLMTAHFPEVEQHFNLTNFLREDGKNDA